MCIRDRVFLQEWNSIISPRRISACESMTSEFSAMFGSDEPIEWPSKTLPWFKRSGRLTDVQGAEIPFTFGSGPAKVNLRIHEVTKLRAVTALRGFSRPVYDHNGNPAKNVPLGNRYESGEEWYAAVEYCFCSSWLRERTCSESNHSPATRILSSCLLYTSPSPRDLSTSRMPSSA